jgi:hypothetical protein
VEKRIRGLLKGAGINKTARQAGVGTATVQRSRGEMGLTGPFGSGEESAAA